MPAIQPFSVGFDAYHLGISRDANPWMVCGPAYAQCAKDYEDGWDTAQRREKELLAKADQKYNAQMLDGCETEDEVNAELRAQTQGDA